jgi:hypothetical protein
MTLDFSMLPPEVNSSRMYAGAGPASMVAAASAWKGVAAELRSTALSYGAVVSALTDEEWHGPASAAMAAAAMPYVEWMNTTAVQAEQSATQAEAAVAAYEAAFAATVPPADRGQPCPAGLTGRDQPVGPKHPRDRGHRGPVRRDVGPRRRGDVRLRGVLGRGHPADPV